MKTPFIMVIHTVSISISTITPQSAWCAHSRQRRNPILTEDDGRYWRFERNGRCLRYHGAAMLAEEIRVENYSVIPPIYNFA